jgi:hypothetical protein
VLGGGTAADWEVSEVSVSLDGGAWLVSEVSVLLVSDDSMLDDDDSPLVSGSSQAPSIDLIVSTSPRSSSALIRKSPVSG